MPLTSEISAWAVSFDVRDQGEALHAGENTA